MCIRDSHYDVALIRPLDQVDVTFTLRIRSFDDHDVEGRSAPGLRCDHRPHQSARPGAGIDQRPPVGPTGRVPKGVQAAGETGAEERAQLDAGEKIGTSAGRSAGVIEPDPGLVQRQVPQAIEAQPAGQRVAQPRMQAGGGFGAQLPTRPLRQLRAGYPPSPAATVGTVLSWVTRSGRTPVTTVSTRQMAMAAMRFTGTLIGDTSPSGASSNHIARATAM